MARGGNSGASGRLILGAVFIACAWIVGYWVTPAPGSRDVEVEFGPPPKADEIAAPPPPPPIVHRETRPVDPPITPLAVPDDQPDNVEPLLKPKDPNPSDLPRIVPPKFFRYLSAEGDTFGTIAAKFLKDPDKWTIIAQANPTMDPNKLRPGTVVMVPMDPDNIQGRENLEGFQMHTIKSGDSLSTISKHYYGKASLWGVIAAANPEVNPDRLKVGAKIKIPPAPVDPPPAPSE